jgi:hypothetical protein
MKPFGSNRSDEWHEKEGVSGNEGMEGLRDGGYRNFQENSQGKKSLRTWFSKRVCSEKNIFFPEIIAGSAMKPFHWNRSDDWHQKKGESREEGFFSLPIFCSDLWSSVCDVSYHDRTLKIFGRD